MNPIIRWGKFNLVGDMGMVMQLAALALFNRFRRRTISMPRLLPLSLRSYTILYGTCTTCGAIAATTPHCHSTPAVSSFQWSGLHAGESSTDANSGP
jgi:hypothetical protein